ncbi:MAG TPA: enoyl-CoA hydratase/isomerase family protein [Burkholderiales bacterium]|nr:enoyl-CoA hydratase/isomerase family protein [Burkholderiales bacterium]
MSESIAVTKNAGIATLILNRPDAFNAFDLEMAESFAGNLSTLASDRSVRGIVLSGSGKAFCAGGDLKWALSFEQGTAAAFHVLAGRFHLAITEIRRMGKPVIAAVNGVAAGGGFSLALACDFRVMARSAVLRQAYTSSGLCIDGGGTFTLPRLVGLARALDIAAFDRPITAEQALSWGLATQVVEDEMALDSAATMAGEFSQRSLNAFAAAKQLLTDSFDTAFETQLEREREALSACSEHPEGQEGLRAFSEKRKPRYGPA